jgi:hypothetical protein
MPPVGTPESTCDAFATLHVTPVTTMIPASMPAQMLIIRRMEQTPPILQYYPVRSTIRGSVPPHCRKKVQAVTAAFHPVAVFLPTRGNPGTWRTIFGIITYVGSNQ